MTIINMTQHSATAEQIRDGVVEPQDKAGICSLLTFNELPTAQIIQDVAGELATLAHTECIDHDTRYVMIGGAPYLMAPLEAQLKKRGLTPLYAFSVRESVDQTQPDGSVRKVAVFRHAGFVQSE